MTKNRKNTPDILSMLMDGPKKQVQAQPEVEIVVKSEQFLWQESEDEHIKEDLMVLEVPGLEVLDKKEEVLTWPVDEAEVLEQAWFKLCHNMHKEKDVY